MKPTIFLFVFLSTLQLYAQNAWQVLSPKPTGIALHGISMTSENEFWIIGEQGKLFHTIDKGAVWEVQQLPQWFFYRSIQMIDSDNGWVLAMGDTIFKTTDGGLNWQAISIPTNWYNYGLYFKNIHEGWISGNSDTLLHTIDGGVTWSIDTLQGASITHILFTDTVHGWLFGFDGAIWKTGDGGATWNKIVDASNWWFDNIRAVSFTDSLTGYFSAFSWDSIYSTLYKTTDGGYTWNRLINYPSQMYGGGIIKFFDNLNGILIDAEYSHYALTHDGGISWNDYSLGLKGPLSFVDIYNNSVVAVGLSGAMMQSDDLGLTTNDLVERIIPSTAINSVCFPDTLTGYINAGNKGLYKSIDGGNSWLRIDSTVTGKIFFETPDRGWAIGGISCTSKMTTDGGLTWTNSVAPQYVLIDFFFSSELKGWGVDQAGNILSTVDGGIHWQADTSKNNFTTFYTIHFSDSLHGWTAGSSTYNNLFIWKTVDGGITWEENYVDSLIDFYGPNNKIFSTDPDHVWLAGNSNIFLRTSDGGASWSEKTLLTPDWNFITGALFFADTLTGYCGGQYFGSDILLKTIDGGDSWTTVLQNNCSTITALSYVDSSHIWLAGIPSFLAVYRDAQSVGVPDLSLDENTFRVFPNPASSYVSFTIPPGGTTPLEINVVDITGRTVMHTSGNPDEKNHICTLDITGFAPGMYFVHLERGDYNSDTELIKR